eukprot:1144446-Pelagomonas_calceolata.AAC.10
MARLKLLDRQQAQANKTSSGFSVPVRMGHQCDVTLRWSCLPGCLQHCSDSPRECTQEGGCLFRSLVLGGHQRLCARAVGNEYRWSAGHIMLDVHDMKGGASAPFTK